MQVKRMGAGRWGWLLTLVLLGALLASCGGSRQAQAPRAEGMAGRAGPSAVASDTAASAPAQPAGREVKEQAARAGKPATAPAPPSEGLADREGRPDGPGTGTVGADPAAGRKIILNADISLRVRDARAALSEIQDLANFNRGYVADANLTGSDEGGWNGRIVLRIPSAHYGNVLEKLRGLGEVRQERQWSNDVTEQYIDLEARIKILTEHEQRLRELALKASTFDEWLKLTQQVNETRIQLENLTGRLRLLSNQVEFSTLNISLVQPPPGKGEREGQSAPLAERMVRAFTESARALLQLGEGLLVFLAGFLPVGAVMAGALAGILLVIRGVARRGAGKAAPPPFPPAQGGNGT